MKNVAPPVVFDTNSLWNFAVVERLDVLQTRYGERVVWTESVEDEIRTSERFETKLAMVSVDKRPWLGPAKALASQACIADVERIRVALAGPSDSPTKHLGEAECIHYIQHELAGNGWFVTDDRAAADMATMRRLHVLNTADVLQECFASYELLCPEPFDLLCQMADAGRGVWVPFDHSQVC